jgi:hypothetical protein
MSLPNRESARPYLEPCGQIARSIHFFSCQHGKFSALFGTLRSVGLCVLSERLGNLDALICRMPAPKMKLPA